MKPPTAREAKANAARRAALAAALDGKTEASSTSLARSYGLPLDEVRRSMRSRGVNDNG